MGREAAEAEEKKLPVPAVEEDSDDDYGPAPAPEKPSKRRKVLEFQQVYLDSLPSATCYEKSYMHVGEVNHVRMTPKTDFIVTASVDGQLKFWKKKPKEIEFVKRFYAHVGPVTDVAVSPDGVWLCTVGSKDKVLNVFDVINFDMVSMTKLDFVPSCVEWVTPAGKNKMVAAVGSREDSKIRLYDCKSGKNEPASTLSLHGAPVLKLRYNAKMHAVISTDARGLLEIWDPDTHKQPAAASFKYKSDTDLYELAKSKTTAMSLDVSPDGELFACLCADKHVRVFRCATGKLYKKIDETPDTVAAGQQDDMLKLDTLDFGRRMAVDKEMDALREKEAEAAMPNAIFDQSGKLLLFPTTVGIKVMNLVENKIVRLLGKPEGNERFLGLALYQGNPNKRVGGDIEQDPTLIATSFNKNRFYLFSRREPDESSESGQRDVYNERPPKELALAGAGPQAGGGKSMGRGAIIHTSFGDITVKLYPDECPKTVENFTTHSKNEYYNGTIIHRVIKSFMVQMGDPLGDGTGGTSIWGKEFEDEFHRNLRHDRPFTLSMANAGPGTNGSQFFITTVPTPWLDNKHTVFGRVVKGMDVVQMIENTKCGKDDKPADEIKIINIKVLAEAPSAK
mmetsp:Transcript_52755/g.128841  ORF Transcript_52755/g.128841 Transcript_52755/m.128841 type:complete len:621 (+) Transcript_52755:164-2026(+)